MLGCQDLKRRNVFAIGCALLTLCGIAVYWRWSPSERGSPRSTTTQRPNVPVTPLTQDAGQRPDHSFVLEGPGGFPEGWAPSGLACRVAGIVNDDRPVTLFLDVEDFDPYRHMAFGSVRDGVLKIPVGLPASSGSGVVRASSGAPARVAWRTDDQGTVQCTAPLAFFPEQHDTYGWVHGEVSLTGSEPVAGEVIGGVVSGCGSFQRLDDNGRFTVSVLPGTCTFNTLGGSSVRGPFRGRVTVDVTGGQDLELEFPVESIPSGGGPAEDDEL